MSEKTFLSRRLRQLPRGRTPALLTLLGALDRLGFPGGPARHRLAAAWLRAGPDTLDDLPEWLEANTVDDGAGGPGGRRLLSRGRGQSLIDRAADEARKRYSAGLRAAAWVSDPSRPEECPAILLVRGETAAAPCWTAVFNSRKGRCLTADAPWLTAFRAVLFEPAFREGGWAASTGTLSYELVASHARATGAPLLMVCPGPLPNESSSEPPAAGKRVEGPQLFLSCRLGGPLCPKSTRLVCRDRILAALSDRHVALEIRSGGNLLKVLSDEQARAPRPLWIFGATGRTAASGGNRALLERFPEQARPFSCPAPPSVASTRRQDPAREPPVVMTLSECRQQEYLYHYTRACPGPWPGQAPRDYHLDLIAGRPGCAHRAVDALCRMLEEGRIRASSTLIKGETAVICWSARSFRELATLRKWRPGLIRWTLEPYGIAVARKTLRRLGAKPAIYLPPDLLRRLRPADRYRYQRHEPPRCAWKHEREWRLAGDLDLTSLTPAEAFVMVPHHEAARELAARIHCPFPVVVA